MATIEPYVTDHGRRYMVRYRTPERAQTKKRGFKTRRDAEAFAATVEVQKARGEFVGHRATQVTLGELGPSWLQRQRGHLKESSWRPLEIAWRVHVEPRWGTVRVSEVTYTAVQGWVSDLSADRSPTTVKRAFGVLSGILDDAVKDRRLVASPAAGVKTPRKTDKPRVYLTHDQVQSLAVAARGAGPIVTVLAYTGIRWGELAALRVRDVDLVRRRLTIEQNAVEVGSRIVVGTPKGHERRSVPFVQLLDDVLAAACRDKLPNALVFTGTDGGHLRRSKSGKGWFWQAATAIGVPELTPHDLRHTAASLAISAGANAKVVQRMLGHKSAAMTLDTYADLFEDDLDAVAVAMNAAAVAAAALGRGSS